MKRWIATFKISGSATAIVEASSQAEAIQKARMGEWIPDSEVAEWDMEDMAYGGWIEVEEADQ